ncbi:MAG TPA: PEP-CTERM sorting domain-containing protein, partial [bacterium]|nr:PEP-CTERM sorting domain-containing protein [bacterium]
AASQSTKIVGSYSGPGGSTEKTTQTYSFTATIDADGNLVLTGKGALQGSSHTITIAAADVAAQIYYQDPTWKIDETTDGTFADNDVYGAAVRDILAGFAIGYVNSPVINPATGQPFKDSDSNTWWGSAENFDTLQTDPLKPYFNQYAMEFYRYSNSYGFPYSDRLESKPVQIGLNPATVDTLEITIMTDGAAVPEPSTMAFFGVGLIGLAAVSLKRSRR